VRNPNKISQERLYEMAKKLYLVQIMVEGYECDDGESSKPDDDGDDQDGGVRKQMMMLMIWMTLLREWILRRRLVLVIRVSLEIGTTIQGCQENRDLGHLILWVGKKQMLK
jgi:hypothetical protein